MSLRTDNARGWIGTILFHLFLALLLFLWKLDTSVSQPEYLELSLGSVTSVSSTPAPRPSLNSSASTRSSSILPKSKAIELPERRFAVADEVIRVPASSKLAADGSPSKAKHLATASSDAAKDITAHTGAGHKEKFTAQGVGENAGEVTDPFGRGSTGSEIGKSVAFSMQWSDGGNRKKISGALPEYPAGVKVETQIKIEITVSPDGAVKSLRPAQRGNTKLEDAAMKETRYWRFEPLGTSLPQRDQTCVVTFNFLLR